MPRKRARPIRVASSAAASRVARTAPTPWSGGGRIRSSSSTAIPITTGISWSLPDPVHPGPRDPPSGGWRRRKGSLDMLLIVIRAAFVLVVAGLGVRVARIVGENQLANPYVMFVGMLIAAIVVVAVDLLTPR